MCTISVMPFEGGYSLFMNRDESPLRPRATRLESGPGWAYPVDAKAAGTWIGLNSQGLGLCLMNQHPQGWKNLGGLRSRGALIPSLMDSGTANDALLALLEKDLAAYAPFLLLALGREGAFEGLRWDGRAAQALSFERVPLMLCSSAVLGAEVQASRAALFKQGLEAVQASSLDEAAAFQARFHRSHEPEKGAFSVCLHRSDAISVSLSELRVDAKSGRLRSSLGPVCGSEPGVLEAAL